VSSRNRREKELRSGLKGDRDARGGGGDAVGLIPEGKCSPVSKRNHCKKKESCAALKKKEGGGGLVPLLWKGRRRERGGGPSEEKGPSSQREDIGRGSCEEKLVRCRESSRWGERKEKRMC